MRFALGQIAVTPSATQALQRAGQVPEEFLDRHARGDWGDLTAAEKEESDRGLAEGSRVRFLSIYPLKTQETIWVFTDLRQNKTTVMLADEQLR